MFPWRQTMDRSAFFTGAAQQQQPQQPQQHFQHFQHFQQQQWIQQMQLMGAAGTQHSQLNLGAQSQLQNPHFQAQLNAQTQPQQSPHFAQAQNGLQPQQRPHFQPPFQTQQQHAQSQMQPAIQSMMMPPHSSMATMPFTQMSMQHMFSAGWRPGMPGMPTRTENNKSLQEAPRSEEQGQNGSTDPAAPEAEMLFCEACEKEFGNKEALKQHVKQHVKCDVCAFEAIPKMIAEHKSLLHARVRSWPVTPEEVAQWREERRQRYPTEANVKRREEEEDAKAARGEVAESEEYRWRGGSYKAIGKRKASSSVKPSKPADDSKAATEAVGLAALAAYGSDDDEDSESEHAGEKKNEDGTGPSEDEAPVEQSSKALPVRAAQPTAKRTKLELEGSLRRPPSLLERLLAQDVRRERNVILQCVQYIVAHNFFDKAQTKAIPDSAEPEGDGQEDEEDEMEGEGGDQELEEDEEDEEDEEESDDGE